MDFKEWFYAEVRHVNSMSVDNINLQPIMDGYVYEFNYQGEKFKVTFMKDFDLEYQNKKVPNSYTIFFTPQFITFSRQVCLRGEPPGLNCEGG